jgi:hypothetical protein
MPIRDAAYGRLPSSTRNTHFIAAYTVLERHEPRDQPADSHEPCYPTGVEDLEEGDGLAQRAARRHGVHVAMVRAV